MDNNYDSYREKHSFVSKDYKSLYLIWYSMVYCMARISIGLNFLSGIVPRELNKKPQSIFFHP